MPRILQLETATSICSVSLAEDGVVTGLEETHEKNSHATVLHIFVDKLLRQQGLSYASLDAIAVSMGPGSYTGLRIGVAAAKGFGFALDIPVIAIHTLKAMTAHYLEKYCPNPDPGACFRPLLDARRMEVYTARYDRNLNEQSAPEAVVLDTDSFRGELDSGEVHLFGDGSSKFTKLANDHPNARFMENFSTSSTGLTRLALQAYNARQFIDLAYFEPFYLKDFVSGPKKQF